MNTVKLDTALCPHSHSHQSSYKQCVLIIDLAVRQTVSCFLLGGECHFVIWFPIAESSNETVPYNLTAHHSQTCKSQPHLHRLSQKLE